MDDVQAEVMRTQSPKSYLYSTLATTHLGEVSSVIITTLISSGRLTIKELTIRTKLTIKVVKKALVSLIQLNCIYYWKQSDTYYYSFNEIGLLKFLHSGDILNYITKQYGEEEAEIIQNVLTFGSIKLHDYLSQFENETRLQKQQMFYKLFNDKWIMKLNQFNFNPINDIWDKLFQDSLKNIPRSSSQSEIKRVAEATEKTRAQLKTLLEKSQTSDIYITENGIKKLDPNLILTFNLARFQKHLRTRSLVNLAKSRIGLISSKIYEAGLKAIETNSPDLTDPEMEINGLLNGPNDIQDHLLTIEGNLLRDNKIVFNARDISRLLAKEIDISDSIQTEGRKVKNGDGPPMKKVKMENGQSHDIHEEHDQDIIQNHLNLLSSGTSTSFITQVSPGRYTVPFYNLTSKLKSFNFEYLIKSTLKDHSFRVFRCIKQQKLSDEKSISNSVLLREKQVRSEVYNLIKNGFVEIQEIPRSADRAASKTFYTFRVKNSFNYAFLLNCLIYDLGEVLQIIQNFKYENRILLEKCNRIDVKGKENELLLESELKTLHGLQNREIKNLVKFNRIKSLYDIFNI